MEYPEIPLFTWFIAVRCKIGNKNKEQSQNISFPFDFYLNEAIVDFECDR